jgi:RimJ/RimL family protein N-acetyltransferase
MAMMVIADRASSAEQPLLLDRLRQVYGRHAYIVVDRRHHERRVLSRPVELNRRATERRYAITASENEAWRRTGYWAQGGSDARTPVLEPVGADHIELLMRWLGEKENHQWLDFGQGRQVLSPMILLVMAKRDTHMLRVFKDRSTGTPIGLVALSDISPGFKSAVLWYVLGAKEYAGLGYTSRAVALILEEGFVARELDVVSAWTVVANEASARVLEKNGFRPVGRQRRCHYIDGIAHDRLLFDLLVSEFRPLHAAADSPRGGGKRLPPTKATQASRRGRRSSSTRVAPSAWESRPAQS